MHGDDHVGRPAFERGVGGARVELRQRIGIVAAAGSQAIAQAVSSSCR
jgi:hypothetical protein